MAQRRQDRPLPLAVRARTLLAELVPTPDLVLRSAALGGVLISSLLLALVAWVLFYSIVGTGKGVMKERVWLQYGHGKVPYAQISLPSTHLSLVTATSYAVSLSLVVPNSPTNQNLGNFMASLAVTDGQGKPIASASRPATLEYLPTSHLHLTSLIPFPFSLFFPRLSTPLSSSFSQTIKIPLIEDEVLSTRWRTARSLEVEVGRRDGWGGSDGKEKGFGGEVQVYESWLYIEEKLKGLRGLLTYHPILSFLTFFPTFLFFELFSATLIWALFISRSLSPSSSSLPTDATSHRNPNDPTSPPPILSELDSDDSGSTFVRVKKEEDGEGDESEAQTGPLRSGTAAGDFSRVDREEYRLRRLNELERDRRMGVRMGGVIPPSDEEEEEDGEDEAEEEETSGSTGSTGTGEGWEGVEAGEEKDDVDTIGGSETTRGTISSFGPSLASTSRSTATVESSTMPGMRARPTAGVILEEED